MKKSNLFFIGLYALILLSCSASGPAHRYYVDAKSGNDSNSGTSPNKAWATLARVNQQLWTPGDTLFFKCSTSYNGQLVPKGSGTAAAPIVITSYGKGVKPSLLGHGEKKYTLLLGNVQYYEVSNLDISNTGNTRKAGRTGVFIRAINAGDMHHIVLSHLDVHDVNGSLVKKAGGGSAIFWRNGGDSIPTRFVDLRIEHCLLFRCGRNGINSWGNTKRNHWYPSLGVVISHNLLEQIPGDGIVPIGCDSAIVEYNIMRDGPDTLSNEEAAAGIWPWSSDHTIIQYNEVSGHKAKWDGQGFDSDYNCHGTVIRYNYSHDNYGGFLLVCNDGNSLGSDWNKGTLNSRIEYNLSVNDGIRPYPTKRSGWFSPIFHITGPVNNTLIAHNIIIVPKRNNQEIPNILIKMGDWGKAWPVKTTITQNNFFVTEKPQFNWGSAQQTTFSDNITKQINKSQTVMSLLDEIIQKTAPSQRAGYRKLKDFLASRIR